MYPHERSLVKQLADKPFALIGVNSDSDLEKIRETVKEIVIPTYVKAPPEPVVTPPLFANRSDEELLQYGVPAEWLADVREATEDSLLILADRLPSEAAEALLELATGGTPTRPELVTPVVNPLDHPDAQRRFRVPLIASLRTFSDT